MTPTSDERREVAQALRDANDTELYVMYLDEILAGALGICPTDSYENVERKILDRLADLIDPTCEVESVDSTGGLLAYNLSCGDTAFAVQRELRPSYCPNCGARVVSGNGE